MDNVTHSLFALTLARTPLARAGRGTSAALLLASNAPDIDIVAALGGGANYLAWHRGPTHGPFGVVGLALMTAALVWGGYRVVEHRAKGGGHAVANGAVTFKNLLTVSLVGVLAHILMDLPTAYGTRLLSPFSWRWFALDLLPIIDLYLLAILVLGLVFGSRSAETRRTSAAIVLALMAVNYGVRAFAHHEALNLAERLFGPLRPTACSAQASSPIDTWPRATSSSVQAPGSQEGSCPVETAAIPSFGSPFQWRIIAQFPDAYEIYEIDVTDQRVRSATPSPDLFDEFGVRITNHWTPAVVEAARTETAQIFLGFSRFPRARVSGNAFGAATVRLSDLRFITGFEEDSPMQARRSGLFTVTVQIGPDGEIVAERLGQ